MQRRALLQTAAVALLAGCAGGGDTPTSTGTDADGTGGTDGEAAGSTRTPAPTSTEYEHTVITVTPNYNSTVKPAEGSVTGTVVTEGWTAEALAGRVDAEASTVAIEGRIRNGTESDYWPVAVLVDFFDADGTELASTRAAFDVTVEVIPNDILTVLQTIELPSTDVTKIETMELDLEMRG